MKYTVVWTRRAESRLADLWLAAADRNDVAQASDAIDIELSRDPLRAGESRRGRTRVLHIAPLAVHFDVFPDDNRVEVWSVWRTT